MTMDGMFTASINKIAKTSSLFWYCCNKVGLNEASVTSCSVYREAFLNISLGIVSKVKSSFKSRKPMLLSAELDVRREEL